MVTIKIILIIAFINYLLYFLKGRKKTNLAFCGLIGYSGKENYNLDKIKFLMLWNAYERGKDATGMYTPSSGVLKDNDPAWRFFNFSEIKKLVPDNQLLAHVRAKTIGQNLAKNAHPFDVDDIVLAHNGTLIEYYELAKKYDMKHNDWDVDSQILAKGVSLAFKEGTTLDNLHIEAFSEYRGAAATIFYSKSLDTMFVFKDKERTLFYAYDDNGGMYVSSIDDSLKALNLKDTKAFDNNTLYTIQHGEITKREMYKTYAETHKKDWNGKVRGRESGQKFPNIAKNQKGIDLHEKDFKPYWFLNMWLLCDNQVWGSSKGYYDKIATLKKNSFYRVTGWYDENVSVVQVEDEDGNLGQTTLSNFDLEHCIVQNGDVYELTTGITAKKGKQILWNKGDKAMATSFDMKYGRLFLWHIEENRSFEVETDWCKPLDIEESLKYWTALEETSESKVDTLPENSPFIEEENKSDENEKLPDYISSGIYLGLCDLMDNEINALEEEYTENKDLTPKINDIRSKISVSRDKTYLATLALQN